MSQPVVPRVFPDVQAVLVDALTVWVDPSNTDIETPDNLQERLPFLRVIRTGGGRDRLSDAATVDIDVFASTYAEGRSLAERIAQWLTGPPPPVGIFDRVTCEIAPRELPWGDIRIRRFGATYQVITRRVTA